MDPSIAMLVGVGAGLVCFLHGFRAWRRLRLIEDTPTAKVRSMALGRVELEGRAEAKTELEAPLTGLPCVFFRYEIEEERRSRRYRRWSTVGRGDSRAQGFYLADETGRVLVEATGAELHLACDWRATDPPLGSRLLAVLTRHGIPTGRRLFRRRLRFREWRIAAGEPLYVLGVAQERPALAGERRGRLAQTLATLKNDPAAMAALDANRDGHVDAHEWEVARRGVVDAIAREHVEDRIVVAAAPNRES
ncbi:MAG: hypothetical protein L0027_02775, partial [Candidatus Rokubacteria bacterium]|nr:hypothetical protein [Candidatus Rokubacteria bacterium]